MCRKPCLLAVIFALSAAFACAQEAPATPSKPAPAVSLAPWVLHAKLVDGAPPEYPASARENNVQGDAFVDVVVDENGKVETASWVNCLNCSSTIGAVAVVAVN